jgi:hypothetical protein
MSNKIGQLIGIVKHTFSIKNNAGDEVKGITIKIDFSTVNDTDIQSWLCSNRVIAGQRPWRGLSAEELEGLNGKTFNANTIGQKVKSREEQLANIKIVLKAAGVKDADLDIMAEAALEKIA